MGRGSKVEEMMRYIIFCIILIFFLAGCSGSRSESSFDLSTLFGKDETVQVPEESIELNYDPVLLMQRAEAYYVNKQYPEAIEEYKRFIKIHPTHKLAGYAQYKIGMSYFNQMKEVNRSPEPVMKALEAFKKVISDYPRISYKEDARAKADMCIERLAEYQFIIGKYYYKKSAYLAASSRFKQIADDYPKAKYSEDALYYLSVTYIKLKDVSSARQALEELLKRYPDTKYKGDAKRLLAKYK
ncbi:MAG: outer membrane protein assembly factor BamD [Nitrospirae bacterium]|nr:outer membrane protein assembly factor BamD [Nitrospirota bacterium]